MRKRSETEKAGAGLRRRAEAVLKQQQAGNKPGESDTQRMLHQLQVHQIELEMMKEELASSEERARLAIEAANLAVWDYDLAGGRLYLSEAWPTFLGGKREPTVTTIEQFLEQVPEADRQLVTSAIAKAENDPKTSLCRATHRVTRPDGGYVWVRNEGKIVARDAEGRGLRMIGVMRNITERVQAEIELRAREARYRAVIETSVDGFWVVDMDNRLTEVNDAYAKLSGYSRQELTGMHVSDLEASETPAEIDAHLERVIRDRHDRFNTLHRRKDGSIWPVEISVNYWPEFDVNFVFVHDLSEKQALEKQLQEHRDEMNELQKRQVAAQTAAAFAHELNQPLTAIASYCKAALMQLGGESASTVDIRRALEESEEQALRAGDTIREILGLLNLGEVAAEAFDLNHELLSVLALARNEHGLRFHTELALEEGLPPVRAKCSHLRKVLSNLLHNSIEAMQEAGVPLPQITIRACTDKDRNAARVTVQDNGPGFRQQDVNRLFEPFFTTKENGIGMGLAISRSLIEANGGQLWAEPQEGPGATFHLTLPFDQ